MFVNSFQDLRPVSGLLGFSLGFVWVGHILFLWVMFFEMGWTFGFGVGHFSHFSALGFSSLGWFGLATYFSLGWLLVGELVVWLWAWPSFSFGVFFTFSSLSCAFLFLCGVIGGGWLQLRLVLFSTIADWSSHHRINVKVSRWFLRTVELNDDFYN